MVDPVEREGAPAAKFSISSYRDGYYQPNGLFIPERLFPDVAITNWENLTRFKNGGVWGYGQALFLKDQPLVFGRDGDQVDVKVDWDPDENGYPMAELGVSRRHFQLQTLSERDVLITDLNSHNGVRIFSQDSKLKTTLNSNNPRTNLGIGDFAIFGGGGAEESQENARIIGFRVCSDDERGLFLVKFNARNLDDLLALNGRVRQADEAVSNISTKDDPELNSGLESSFNVLVDKMAHVSELSRNTHNPGFFIAQGELIADILSISQDLGTRFFKDDPTLAVLRIGFLAMEKGEKLLKEGNKQESARALELSLFLENLASGRLIQRVDDR